MNEFEYKTMWQAEIAFTSKFLLNKYKYIDVELIWL